MPGARSGKLYSPAPEVSTVRVNPVAVLSSRTEHTGIAAPEVSVTVPVRLPRKVCAHRPDAKRATRKMRGPNMQTPRDADFRRVLALTWSVSALKHAAFNRACPDVIIYRVHSKFG